MLRPATRSHRRERPAPPNCVVVKRCVAASLCSAERRAHHFSQQNTRGTRACTNVRAQFKTIPKQGHAAPTHARPTARVAGRRYRNICGVVEQCVAASLCSVTLNCIRLHFFFFSVPSCSTPAHAAPRCWNHVGKIPIVRATCTQVVTALLGPRTACR